MKKSLSFPLLLLLLIVSGSSLWANNLRVTNLSRDSTAQTVTFDLAWDNSWRVDSSGSPSNWDAAWVFIKFRECGAAATTPWTHARIDTGSGANAFGGLQPHSIDGGMYYSDSLGVMLRRPTNGIFPSAAASTVTLRIDNIAPTGQYDVKVFGIEMVYIPQSNFFLGVSRNSSNYSFSDGAGNPIEITSEAGFTLNNGNSNNTNWLYQNAAMTGFLPKGYDAFYCMKYEISEGQYAAFLNTITAPAQLNRYPGNYGSYRNVLNNTGAPPDIYVAEREDRAQSYLSFSDIATYFDWAALRFITELEYEKACRGEAPSVLNEYAWGTNTISRAQTISTAPEDGTETIFFPTDANANYSPGSFTGGDAGQGPLRVGIFARPTSNSRVGTGATFYGIMEMSGNVRETVIDYRNGVYNGEYGDGEITSAGLYDVGTWPTTGSNQWGYRGGDFLSGVQNLNVSHRQYMPQSNYTVRYREVGGRGGR